MSSGEAGEDPRFLTEQLITCIGNKRRLLDFIGRGVAQVRDRLGGRRLDVADLFAGSGVVSRYLKQHAHRIVANDLEPFAAAVTGCFLHDRAAVDGDELASRAEALDARRLDGDDDGFLARLYAPADDEDILPGERVFYSRRNARILDNLRQGIAALPEALQPLLLGPLLSEASIHANTSGVFKGFYKNSRTGRGQFGGDGRHALRRILGEIRLRPPVLSRFAAEHTVHCTDAGALAGRMAPVDLAYVDPPYNQHPYGSNYFMLNLVTTYQAPDEEAMSPVSGIPKGWRRSPWNRAGRAGEALSSLLEVLPASFVLLSYSSEGLIGADELTARLARFGRVQVLERDYPTFRGSRNLRARAPSVTERLYLLERR